jgi:hypothetical protein
MTGGPPSNNEFSIAQHVLRACPSGRYATPAPDALLATLQRPWRVLTDAGTVIALENDSPYIVKLFKNVDGVLAKYRSWGTDVGGARWTPFPSDEHATATWALGTAITQVAYAWDNLRDVCATLYTHLGNTNDAGVLDIEGVQLPIGTTPFFVQHRAELVGERVDTLMHRNEISAAQTELNKWLEFFAWFLDNDMAAHPNFDENYGYVDDELLLLDVGDIRLGSDAVRLEVEGAALLTMPAMKSLQASHPELAKLFHDDCAAFLEQRRKLLR